MNRKNKKEHKARIIADADYHGILDAYDLLSNSRVLFPPLFGDGHAAKKILDTIKEYLS